MGRRLRTYLPIFVGEENVIQKGLDMGRVGLVCTILSLTDVHVPRLEI